MAYRTIQSANLQVNDGGARFCRRSAADNGGDLATAPLGEAHFTGDLHASVEYRMHLTRVMAQRALAALA